MNIKIDRRLTGVANAVANRTLDLVIGALERSGLIARSNPKDHDDFVVVEPLTEGGADAFFQTLAAGLGVQFVKADIRIPAEYVIEEMALIDGMMETGGEVETRIDVDHNLLRVEWAGPGALIKRIETPLDVGKAVAALKSPEDIVSVVHFGPKPIITGQGEVMDLNNESLNFFRRNQRDNRLM